MRIAVYEDNLMWSPRLRKNIEGLGHEAVMVARLEATLPEAEMAIVNLGSVSMKAETLVPRLKQAGQIVVAHAGHKEKDLHALGRDLGCDLFATNSELANHLAKIIDKVAAKQSPG
ncbi:MAG: hypothetical protein ABUL72_04370 [Armatimonadota bacterium]